MNLRRIVSAPTRLMHRALARIVAIRKLRDTPALVVLCYHEVDLDERHPFRYRATGIHPEQLHAHLSWCSARFPFIRLHEGIQSLRQGSLTETSVAVTFDDAHIGIEKYAYSILREMNIPATVFVNAHFLDDEDCNWLLKLQYLQNNGYVERLRKLFHCEDEDILVYVRRSSNAKLQQRIATLHEMFREIPQKEIPPLYLGRHFLREEAGRLLDLGNHGYNHYKFSWLSYEQQVEEIHRNHEALREFPNSYPLFAVTYGTPPDWNTDTVRACMSFGYEFITAHGGVNWLGHAGMEIRRFSADRRDIKTFPNVVYQNALMG